jgi:ElaB/YqjD/DUF883 family membrane-anchored ribosome-binding protein
MAEDLQVVGTAHAEATATTAAPPRPAMPEDPAAARAEIEATRARMSETIDEIEDVLMRKTEEIRAKLDVLAPIRQRPLQSLGIIFGVGIALGLLGSGGGRDESDEDEDDELADVDLEGEDDETEEAWERAERWEDRAHRLLRIARAQEAELDIHRSRGPSLLSGGRARHDSDDEDEDSDHESVGDGFFDRIRDGAAERLSGIVSEAMQKIMRGG